MRLLSLLIFCLALQFQAQAWDTPTYDEPANGTSVWTGITLDWNAVSGSESYQLQVDVSPSFDSPQLFQKVEPYINSNGSNADTREMMSSLRFGQAYYWRVRAWVPGDTSNWSSARTFSTRDFVTLDAPNEGDATWSGVNFDWDVHVGVSAYEIQVDTVTTFDSPAFQNDVEDYINSTNGNADTRELITDLYFGKTYYWRVRAINAVDTSAWTMRSISTRDFVTLDSPAEGEITWSGVTFDWDVHVGTGFYEIQVDTVTSFDSPAFQNDVEEYVNSTNGNADTREFINNMYYGATYYWRVRAINAVDSSAWTMRSITTRDFVNLDSPAEGDVTWTGVTFDWDVHVGTGFYEIQVDTVTSFDSPAFQNDVEEYINSTNGNADTREFINNLYYGQTYYWRVRSINAVDTSAWTMRSITTRDFVNLDSPSEGDITWTGVTFDWDVHVGTGFYEIQVDTVTSFDSPAFQNDVEEYINSTNGNADTREFINNMYYGATYYWRVRSINAVDTSGWTMRSITTRDFVNLDSPAEGDITWTGVTFDWDVHTGTGFYEIQVDTVTSFDSPAFQNDIEEYINSTNGNADTREFITDLYFGTTYYWRVRSINAVDTSAWTIRSITTRDFVNLDSPAEGSDEWTGVNFDWDAHVGVDFYELQVDTTTSFDSPAFQNNVEEYLSSASSNNDTREFISDMYFGETYYWRVRAINAVDTSAWTMRSITTRDFVTLSSPADLAVSQSTSGVQLDWAPHNGVLFYEVEWDTSNAYNSPLLMTQLESYISTANGNSDTRELSGALLPEQIYFWRVRAINGVDTSAWTSRAFSTGSDIVLPATPQLITPTNGFSGLGSNVTFDWADAENAVSYAFEYSLSASMTSSTVLTTSVSEEMVNGLLLDEVYYWRVRSVNGGVTSDWSTIWSFDTNTCTSTSNSIAVEACDEYTSPSGDNIWAASGVYEDILVNAQGCDSVLTIDLTILVVDATATLDDVELLATPGAEAYQWLDCDNDFAPVDGAIDQNFFPIMNGNYAVQIVSNGCVGTSDCIPYIVIGVQEFERSNTLILSPNPGRDWITITSELNGTAMAQLRIVDLQGRLVLQQEQIDLALPIDISALDRGTYRIVIISDEAVLSAGFVKE